MASPQKCFKGYLAMTKEFPFIPSLYYPCRYPILIIPSSTSCTFGRIKHRSSLPVLLLKERPTLGCRGELALHNTIISPLLEQCIYIILQYPIGSFCNHVREILGQFSFNNVYQYLPSMEKLKTEKAKNLTIPYMTYL